MGDISMEFPEGWGWKFPCRKGKFEGVGGPIWNSLCGRGLDIFWNYTCILYCMNWLVCMFIFYGVTVETENTTVDPYATNSPQISWWHLTLSILTTCQLVYPLSFTIVYVWRHVGQHPIKCWCGWYTSWHIRWLLGNKSANMSTDCPLTCQPSISRCVDQHVDWVSGDSDDWYSAEVPKFHKIWDIFFQTFLTWKKGAFLWNDQLTII